MLIYRHKNHKRSPNLIYNRRPQLGHGKPIVGLPFYPMRHDI